MNFLLLEIIIPANHSLRTSLFVNSLKTMQKLYYICKNCKEDFPTRELEKHIKEYHFWN